MARTRTTRTTRRSTVEVVEATLEDLADDLLELSERSMKRVLYGALDDVAEDAQRRLKGVFERDIEGGPVPYTKVQPGSKRSSVVANGARRTKGSDRVASNLTVQKRQSTYLKYALGGEVNGGEFDRERDPGDVGAAVERNFVPKKGLARIGLSVTSEGNMRKRTLRALAGASERSGRRKAAAADGPGGKKKQKKPLDDLPIFFGKSGRKATRGFWLRSDRDRETSDRAPHLLVLALDRSDYRDDVLIEGWNRSAEEAMEGLPLIVKRRLSNVLDRMRV